MNHDLATRRAPMMRALLILSALAAGTASAQSTPAPQAAGNNGAMTFPNVRVINAPNAYAVTQAAPGAAGFRAYIDPDTGLLTEPSPEDVTALDAAMPAQTRKPARKAFSIVHLAGGGVAIRLDEQTMSYSIVRRADGGRLVEACVTGEDLAEKLVRLSHEHAPVTGRTDQ